jgi:hypothetical protein
MRKSKIAMFALVALSLAIAVAPAMADNQIIGGHNETSEVNATGWVVGTPTPGFLPGGLAASHLLITEVMVTPTPVEMIEIHNPTASPVDLSDYYLTDAWFSPSAGVISSYHALPSGTFQITTNTDFCSRFPAGSIIPSGGTIVVAMYGAGIDSTYGPSTANFEVTSSDPAIPDMINVGNNLPVIGPGATTLTNTSEFVMLFHWDGHSDNVCDVDYVTWGPITTTSRVDKTGLAVDGPDCDLIATPYNSDTPFASQSTVSAPGALRSVARRPGSEGAESAGGNGCILVTETACPLSLGYWMNHEEEWAPCALSCPLTLGTVVYTQAQWLEILAMAPEGDASLILARQLIAAKLNVCNGADDTPVAADIAAADALIDGSAIPMGVASGSSLHQQMTALVPNLDDFNNGLLSGANCAESNKEIEEPLGSGGNDQGMQLAQNVPNPFRGPTSMAFTVSTPTRVHLGVFDLAGRRIKSLVDDHREAGTYTAVWDGKDDSGTRVKGGIYFYRLQAGANSTMRRMVFIR